MSEYSDQVCHREVIPYIPILTTPYTTYQALIEYWGLLDSKKLWCKLYKHLSIVRKVSIQDILNSFSQIDQSDPIEEVEGQWSTMGILTLLVHVWIRLGKRKQMAYGEQTKPNLQISIDIYPQSNEPALEISINYPQNIHIEDWSILLYHQIEFYCSQYSVLFQESPSKTLLLKSKSSLKIQDIEMPSIIQIQKHQHCHLILNSRPATETYGIGVLDYFKVLNHLNSKRFCRDICSLFDFAEEYCKQMQEIRHAANKVMKYYYVITPDDILVIDRYKIPSFSVLKKQIPIMIPNSHQISEKDRKSLYAYKGGTSQLSKPKHSQWSAALSFLCIISKYESRALFQTLLSKSIQNGSIATFLKKQTARLQSQRQCDSELVKVTLRNWLDTGKGSISILSQDIANSKSLLQPNSSKVKVQNKFSWLEDLLKESKPIKTTSQSKEISKNIEVWKDVKDFGHLEYIRNITPAISSGVTLSTGKENNQFNIDSILNSAPQKTKNMISINGKQISLTFEKTQLNKWKKAQPELKSLKSVIQHTQQNRMNQQNGTESKYNIISMKISGKQYQIGDFSGISIENLEELGYRKQQIRRGSGKCEICQKIFQLSIGRKGENRQFLSLTPEIQTKMVEFILEDYCGHRQCLKCYQQYIRREIKTNKDTPITCFHPQCQQVISIGILQEMIKHNNFIKNDLIEAIIRLKTPQIGLRRCLNPKCHVAASFFTLQKGNKTFYCQTCSSYLCCACQNIFHGGMSCLQFESRAGDLTRYLQSQLIGIYKFKKEGRKVNEVSLKKILKQLKIDSAVLLDQLEALLKVCMAEIWANNEKIPFDIIQPQSICFLEDVVESLKLSLLIFHQKTEHIGAKSDNQLKSLAMEIKDIGTNLLSLKHYELVILYKSCESSIDKSQQSQPESIPPRQR